MNQIVASSSSLKSSTGPSQNFKFSLSQSRPYREVVCNNSTMAAVIVASKVTLSKVRIVYCGASLASRNNSKISLSSMLPSHRSLLFKPPLNDNRRDDLGALGAIILYVFICSGALHHFSILCSGVQQDNTWICEGINFGLTIILSRRAVVAFTATAPYHSVESFLGDSKKSTTRFAPEFTVTWRAYCCGRRCCVSVTTSNTSVTSWRASICANQAPSLCLLYLLIFLLWFYSGAWPRSIRVVVFLLSFRIGSGMPSPVDQTTGSNTQADSEEFVRRVIAFLRSVVTRVEEESKSEHDLILGSPERPTGYVAYRIRILIRLVHPLFRRNLLSPQLQNLPNLSLHRFFRMHLLLL